MQTPIRGGLTCRLETPFLYGTVFMSNAASLFLRGSNLTNLIALHGEHASGAQPSVRVYSSVGVVLVPLSIGAALAALWLVAPGRV